jgi:hypothetical protein
MNVKEQLANLGKVETKAEKKAKIAKAKAAKVAKAEAMKAPVVAPTLPENATAPAADAKPAAKPEAVKSAIVQPSKEAVEAYTGLETQPLKPEPLNLAAQGRHPDRQKNLATRERRGNQHQNPGG